jgi:hypothetical protein
MSLIRLEYKLSTMPTPRFESVPSGRILSRFSGDMAIMDVQISYFSDGAHALSFL